MNTDRLPDYYHALRPFRDVFERGAPILTYHKLGPRPARVRLKGLYVGAALFRKQMAELGAAGFTTPPWGELAAAAGNHRRWIGLTFDDGFRNVLRHGLEPLERHGFHAIQFLVSNLIGKSNEWEQRDGEAAEMLMDDAEVRVWLAAGHRIGSHTRTHPRLTRLSLAQAREEITGSRKAIEDRFGVRIEHFCYPYGDWNEAVRDLVGEAGYLTACTTEPGVNGGGASPLTLKRFTARYRSRNLKAFWRRLHSGI